MANKKKFYRNIILFIVTILFSMTFFLQLAESDNASGLRGVVQELANPPFASTHNFMQKGVQSSLKLK